MLGNKPMTLGMPGMGSTTTLEVQTLVYFWLKQDPYLAQAGPELAMQPRKD